jgi:hypothetical protein
MTVAELGLRIDSSQVAAGARNLDQLSAAARRAEGEFARLQRVAQIATSTFRNIESVARRNNSTFQATAERWAAANHRWAGSNDALRRSQQQIVNAHRSVINALGDLDRQQTRTERSGANLVNTLTRRFTLFYLVTQLRSGVSALVDFNKELAKVGDTAARTGMGTGNLQGFQAAAQTRGVGGAEFLETMLKFNREVAESQRGLGDLARLFRVNGVAAKDTEDAFLKVADLVRNARTEADKFSILQQAGLPASREFVKLMEQGADAIRRQAAEASKFTDEQISKARKMDEEFNSLVVRLEKFGKQAALAFFDPEVWKQAAANALPFGLGRFWQAAAGAVGSLPAFGGTAPERIHDRNLGMLPPLPAAATGNTSETVNAAEMQKRMQFEIVRVGLFGQTPAAPQQQKPKDQDSDRNEYRLPKAA